MTRDEYLEVLATEPATGAQVGAIIGEFGRLGITDRAERLAITAALLGLEHVGSTTDLVMGDAGRLVAMLRRTHDRAELPDVTAAAVDDDQADEHVTEKPRGDLATRLAVLIYETLRGLPSAS
jgi:hypothetical protein